MNGLSSAEATERFKRYGPNRLKSALQRGLVLQFLSHFQNPLVLVLLAASGISALTGDVTGALIIGVIVVMSVTLDFVQAYRAGRAAQRLALQVAVTVTVLRDGKPCELPVTELVPGDVVLLSAGNLVPADATLLQADDFFVNQAQLTGEPYPVEKKAPSSRTPAPTEAGAQASAEAPAASAAPDAWALEAVDAVFMGSSVVSGSARVLIGRTGSATALGQIAVSLSEKAPPTAFESGTRQFGLLIMRLTVLLVLFTLLVNVALQRSLLESFLFAVALAVGLTPELLPMVVSVTVTRGALRMAVLKVIVKRPSAIQDMGAMDVLCTDKTGTLTEATIKLVRAIDGTGAESALVFSHAFINSRFESGMKSPLDEAILAAHPFDMTGWKKLDEVPFDFERRRVSVLVEHDAKRLLIVKGAPEDLLRLSGQYVGADGAERPLDPAARKTFEATLDALGAQGFRALGVASRGVDSTHGTAAVTDESALVFSGFAVFLDPPKASAGATIRAMAEAGISVRVLTGDNEQVTRHVFAEIGVPVLGVLTGDALAGLSDEALIGQLPRINLFCRVNPQQKHRVLLAFKRLGHVVGFMGDGINDAPALHAADVGISVDGAADVARAAADLILLEHDLSVVREAVMAGRGTVQNVSKYVLMGSSSNFGNMFSMAGAALILPFLPMLPIQILLNNLLYDASEIAIPFDAVDPEAVAKPVKWDITLIERFMLVFGPVSSVFDFISFYVLIALFGVTEAVFQTSWFILSLTTQVLVVFVIRTRRRFYQSRPHRFLAAMACAAVVIAIVLPLSPFGRWFGFVAPPLAFFVYLIGATAAYLLAVEMAKGVFYRVMAAQ